MDKQNANAATTDNADGGGLRPNRNITASSPSSSKTNLNDYDNSTNLSSASPMTRRYYPGVNPRRGSDSYDTSESTGTMTASRSGSGSKGGNWLNFVKRESSGKRSHVIEESYQMR